MRDLSNKRDELEIKSSLPPRLHKPTSKSSSNSKRFAPTSSRCKPIAIVSSRNSRKPWKNSTRNSQPSLTATRQRSSSLQESLDRELTSLNAQLGVVAQEVTLLTDEQEELLTAHEAPPLLSPPKRDSLTEQVEELTESVAVLEEDRNTLREEKCWLEAECERVDGE
ncbi:hypothetical protein quinque_014532 [Culex quinquefasciatus]